MRNWKSYRCATLLSSSQQKKLNKQRIASHPCVYKLMEQYSMFIMPSHHANTNAERSIWRRPSPNSPFFLPSPWSPSCRSFRRPSGPAPLPPPPPVLNHRSGISQDCCGRCHPAFRCRYSAHHRQMHQCHPPHQSRRRGSVYHG